MESLVHSDIPRAASGERRAEKAAREKAYYDNEDRMDREYEEKMDREDAARAAQPK